MGKGKRGSSNIYKEREEERENNKGKEREEKVKKKKKCIFDFTRLNQVKWYPFEVYRIHPIHFAAIQMFFVSNCFKFRYSLFQIVSRTIKWLKNVLHFTLVFLWFVSVGFLFHEIWPWKFPIIIKPSPYLMATDSIYFFCLVFVYLFMLRIPLVII